MFFLARREKKIDKIWLFMCYSFNLTFEFTNQLGILKYDICFSASILKGLMYELLCSSNTFNIKLYLARAQSIVWSCILVYNCVLPAEVEVNQLHIHFLKCSEATTATLLPLHFLKTIFNTRQMSHISCNYVETVSSNNYRSYLIYGFYLP